MAEGMTAASKRTFLNRVFFPNGFVYCDTMGMPGASIDVAMKEFDAIRAEIGTLRGFSVEQIVSFANVVVDALRSVWPDQDDEERHLCDDCRVGDIRRALVGFYIAMKLEEKGNG